MNDRNPETKIAENEMVPLTFRVPRWWRKRLKGFCNVYDTTQQAVCVEGATRLMDARERAERRK